MAAVKIGEIGTLLEHFANMLEENRVQVAVVRRLRLLCGIFDGAELMTVAAFLEATRRAPLPTTRRRPTLAQVLPALESLHKFLGPTAGRNLIKGLESVLDELRAHEGLSLAAYVKAVHEHVVSASKSLEENGAGLMDERLVADYVERLKVALGDDAMFLPLIEELRTDKRIGQPEAVAISLGFTGYTPPKHPRYKSIRRIDDRHESLMEVKRRGPTSASRPAA